ncbi:MAG TPA: hypothetical protein VIC35_02885 [Acidimicrobiia bacterium]|jgi:hypothetical protein
MLGFERRVVEGLATTPDPARREAIVGYVDGALQAMPQHLRAGVVAESLLLGVFPTLRGTMGRSSVITRDDLERWNRSRIGVVRQYARLFGSLVLFADEELPAEGMT